MLPEFSIKTRDTLGKRAAYICSNPDCRTSTSGPAEASPDKAVILGEAAHIYGAAPGSARYRADMHDEARARKAFAAARLEQEQVLQQQKDYGPPLCVLGLIDAALGNKEVALQEGRRAMELLPVEKDSINGQTVRAHFAVIAACTSRPMLPRSGRPRIFEPRGRMLGQMPVPDSGTVFGGGPPPGVTTSVADLAPELVGLNTTLPVQLAPDARLDPQLVVRANWPGFVPPMVIPLNDNGTVPVLVTLTVFAELEVPAAWSPKTRLVGVTV